MNIHQDYLVYILFWCGMFLALLAAYDSAFTGIEDKRKKLVHYAFPLFLLTASAVLKYISS